MGGGGMIGVGTGGGGVGTWGAGGAGIDMKWLGLDISDLLGPSSGGSRCRGLT